MSDKNREELLSKKQFLRSIVGKYNLSHDEWQAVEYAMKILGMGEDKDCLQEKLAEAEHRAEVAERALCNALNDDSCYFCNKKSPCECEHRDWGSKECITVLLRQAEKELQEEKGE